jgi:hypothetical protein
MFGEAAEPTTTRHKDESRLGKQRSRPATFLARGADFVTRRHGTAPMAKIQARFHMQGEVKAGASIHSVARTRTAMRARQSPPHRCRDSLVETART